MGRCANSLQLGCDCKGLIHYFDAAICGKKREEWGEGERGRREEIVEFAISRFFLANLILILIFFVLFKHRF
jgi:Copper amine oxidase, enzyme domain